MKWIEIFISISGASAIFFGFIKFFGKRFLELSFQKEIENHKQVLTSKTEYLKNELAIYTHQQNVRFTRLDEKRADVLEKIFEAIYEIQRVIYDGLDFYGKKEEDYYNNIKYSDQLTEKLSNLIRDLSFYRGVKKIYFTPKLDKIIKDGCSELTKVREITYSFRDFSNMSSSDLKALQEIIILKWEAVHRVYNQKFGPIKKEITLEFRTLLGVH